MSEVVSLSEAASLAVHGMGLLACRGRMSAKEMAAVMDVSEAHLAKVFRRLVQGGLALSTRGPGGGFEPARRLDEISLFDVYAAIEGAPEGGHCLFHKERCPFARCLFGPLPERLAAEFVHYMKRTTLEDVRGTGHIQ